MDNRPFGVFDSGLGGLTVLRTLKEHFPNEHFIYLGDTARLPYGTKSPDTIRQYCIQNIRHLLKCSVKAVVIACNSASTQFQEPSLDSTPVFNVIKPGAISACEATQNKKVGLIATRATVQSKAYEKAIYELDPEISVTAQACPLFVPLAEEGLSEDPLTNLIVYRYLHEMLDQGIDTLILGCTHYPILKNAIAKVAGPSVKLIDSGVAISRWIKEEFLAGALSPNDDLAQSSQRFELLTTDYSDHLVRIASQIIEPFEFANIEKVDL